jgi:ketosteroid isomerase-like protein
MVILRHPVRDHHVHDGNLDRVLALLRAIERDAGPEELRGHFHPAVRQREYPSLVAPTLTERGLDEMLAGSVAGRRLLSRQRYDVEEAVTSGDRVVLRLVWTGTLAVPFGSLAVGEDLRAHVAMFVTVRDGLIVHQASYDCYEPFGSAA